MILSKNITITMTPNQVRLVTEGAVQQCGTLELSRLPPANQDREIQVVLVMVTLVMVTLVVRMVVPVMLVLVLVLVRVTNWWCR